MIRISQHKGCKACVAMCYKPGEVLLINSDQSHEPAHAQSKPRWMCARVTLCSAFTKAAVRSGSFFCRLMSQIWSVPHKATLSA